MRQIWSRRCAKAAVNRSGMCCTTTMPGASSGSVVRMVRSASVPPVDAPIATTMSAAACWRSLRRRAGEGGSTTSAVGCRDSGLAGGTLGPRRRTRTSAATVTTIPGSCDRIVVAAWRTTAESSTTRTLRTRFATELPWDPGIDGWDDGARLIAHSRQRLRVPEEQEAVRREASQEPCDDMLLGGRIEIDHDVAAEDQVEPVAHRVRVGLQIELLEPHDVADLRPRLHAVVVLAGAAQHEALQVRRRDLPRPLDGPRRRPRLVEDARGDVRGQHFDGPARARGEVMEQAHGHRDRLLARRTRGAPRPDLLGPCARIALGPPTRRERLLEELELARLPEELRLVGADVVDQLARVLRLRAVS